MVKRRAVRSTDASFYDAFPDLEGPRYLMRIEKEAAKSLSREPANIRAKLVRACMELTFEPTPLGAKRFASIPGGWRIYFGSWRIVYVLNADEGCIDIISAGSRGNVYS